MKITQVTIDSIDSHNTGKGVIVEMYQEGLNFRAGFDFLNIEFRRHSCTIDQSSQSNDVYDTPQSLSNIVTSTLLSYSQILHGVDFDSYSESPLNGSVNVDLSNPSWYKLMNIELPAESGSLPPEQRASFLALLPPPLFLSHNVSIENNRAYCACGTSLGGGRTEIDWSGYSLPDFVMISTAGTISDFGASQMSNISAANVYGSTVKMATGKYVNDEETGSQGMDIRNMVFSFVAINGDELDYWHGMSVDVKNVNGCMILSKNISRLENLLYVIVNDDVRSGNNNFVSYHTYYELKHMHHAILSYAFPFSAGSGNSYIKMYSTSGTVIENFNENINVFGSDDIHVHNGCSEITIGSKSVDLNIKNININDRTANVTVNLDNITNLDVSLPYNTTSYTAPSTLQGRQGITKIEKNTSGVVKEFCLADLVQ